MYSRKLPSGSSKKTEAAGIQLKTTGSSIGSRLPPTAVTPIVLSVCKPIYSEIISYTQYENKHIFVD